MPLRAEYLSTQLLRLLESTPYWFHRVRVLQPTPIIGHLPAARPPRPPRSRLPPAAILPAAMAPPICLLLAAAPLATTLRPGAIAVQSCIQSWTSAPGSRQPPRPTCPPAHLPAFDAIIKQRYAASSQTPPGRERARARSARHRTHASPALPASPNLWRYLRAATCWCREVCFVVAGCRGRVDTPI